MAKCILIMFVLSLSFSWVEAQDIHSKTNTLNKVFEDLVNAYGSAKGKPHVVFTEKGNSYIAQYFAAEQTIKVDEKLFDICMGMGKDSLNALSIVLSHELAHYYNNHNWCTDFAFAIRNTDLGKKIKSEVPKSRLEHETSADYYGLYHACIAGYKPLGIDGVLLDKIYFAYHLDPVVKGYPSKADRIHICNEAQKEITKLYAEFLEGDSALIHKDYEKAIRCFEELTTHFASRENYNNAGTAKTLLALQLKPLERKESEDSNFYYPIEVDHDSRLKNNETRSTLDETGARKMDSLLQSAKKDFEEAISLDHNYDKAYVNLACVFDLLDNKEAAIGKMKELPQEKKNTKSAYRILGIVYYHLWIANGYLDYKEKSEEMFSQLSH